MRYLVFSGDDYYPAGGWRDFKGAHASLAEAKSSIAGQNPDWAQVVDVSTSPPIVVSKLDIVLHSAEDEHGRVRESYINVWRDIS